MSDTFMSKVEEFAELTRQVKALEAEAEKLAPRIAELREQIVAEHPTSGLGSSFKLASGGTVVFSEYPTAKVLDKGAMVEWFLSNNLKDMLGVHSATLLSYCKEEMSKAAPLPAGVEIGSVTRLALRA